MTRLVIGLSVSALLLGCGGESADAPPTVLLGESICAECGMILSDERFATATIIDGERGPEARLFDDFNCQAIYESSHLEEPIVARWSHDYTTRAWLHTEHAVFVRSPRLMAPMASDVAAVSSRSAAEALAKDVEGEILTFEAAWSQLK